MSREFDETFFASRTLQAGDGIVQRRMAGSRRPRRFTGRATFCYLSSRAAIT
jgi:hypothetical protein